MPKRTRAGPTWTKSGGQCRTGTWTPGWPRSWRFSPRSTRGSARSSSACLIRRSCARRSVSRMNTPRWASSRWATRKRRIAPPLRSNAATERPRTSCAAAAGPRWSARLGARPRLREERPHLAVERRDVIGLAARHPVPVDDHFGVLPLAAGAANVVLQGVVARQTTSLHQLRRHEQPRSVADRSDRLAGRIELLHEFARLHLHAQLVGVQSASGEKHRIEFLGVRIFEGHIDREALVLLVVFHALDLGLRRDEHRISASLGSVSSTLSTPSIARIATRTPLRTRSFIAAPPRACSGCRKEGAGSKKPEKRDRENA